MATTEIDTTIRGLDSPVSTEGFNPGVLAITASDRKCLAEQWNAIIDQPLIKWGLNPSVTDEDGLVFPSKKSCASAVELAARLRDHSWPLPTGVIPDGEGGIAFENKQGSSYQRFEMDENGHIMLLNFRDCKLLSQLNVEL